MAKRPKRDRPKAEEKLLREGEDSFMQPTWTMGQNKGMNDASGAMLKTANTLHGEAKRRREAGRTRKQAHETMASALAQAKRRGETKCGRLQKGANTARPPTFGQDANEQALKETSLSEKS